VRAAQGAQVAQVAPGPGRTPPESTAGALTANSLVVVDDDPLQREVLRSQLAAAVRVPVVALDGAAAALAAIEAVQASAQGDTSRMMLLLDLRMPQTDGIELLRRLAEGGYRGAVALMSAAGERVRESAVRLAAELGLRPVGHVGKPASPEALLALVQRWHRRLPAPRAAAPRRTSASELERALTAHEFVLHYQPKLSLADGSLVGVEALVRWRHPREGLVYPDAFIGLAEEHGLIDALTDEVLSLALAQARQWRELGLAPRVAVNVSMDNLRRLDFPERVLARLAEHALAPSDLLLEVTESRLMSDPRAAFDILTRLRLHGVALAIDDFGTGHSSLVQLRDLPFDELKIDRGFVRRCGELASHHTIVKASAAMASQLGMRSVAEGVEDHADWEAARAAGCDVAQGYYISRPMAGELLPLWAQSLAWRRAVGRDPDDAGGPPDDASRRAA
jgi:EAL domain-containing protein (putative c-di-GMP-specific phosphodiesterase class I)/CheY-like chemotaxis protein